MTAERWEVDLNHYCSQRAIGLILFHCQLASAANPDQNQILDANEGLDYLI